MAATYQKSIADTLRTLGIKVRLWTHFQKLAHSSFQWGASIFKKHQTKSPIFPSFAKTFLIYLFQIF